MPAEAALSLTYGPRVPHHGKEPTGHASHLLWTYARQVPCGDGPPEPSFSHLPRSDQTPPRRGR
eukprot:9808322-Alexandrium_andersonii.AAC.1